MRTCDIVADSFKNIVEIHSRKKKEKLTPSLAGFKAHWQLRWTKKNYLKANTLHEVADEN